MLPIAFPLVLPASRVGLWKAPRVTYRHASFDAVLEVAKDALNQVPHDGDIRSRGPSSQNQLRTGIAQCFKQQGDVERRDIHKGTQGYPRDSGINLRGPGMTLSVRPEQPLTYYPLANTNALAATVGPTP